MSTPVLKVRADSIVLTLAENSANGGPIPLSDADVKRFNGAEPIYSALKKLLGIASSNRFSMERPSRWSSCLMTRRSFHTR